MSRILASAALLTSLLFLPAALNAARKALPNEWPQWRGPNRDGISPETGLLETWPEKGPPLVWKAKGLGRGFSSVAVSDGKIYTLGAEGGQERLTAIDAAHGELLWSTPIGGGDHSNGTPTLDGDRVYAIGLKGDLGVRQDRRRRDRLEEKLRRRFRRQDDVGLGLQRVAPDRRRPLDLHARRNDAMMVALDKLTGETIWKAAMPADAGRRGEDGAGYSSIVISHGAGVKQYVQLVGRGVIGVAPTMANCSGVTIASPTARPTSLRRLSKTTMYFALRATATAARLAQAAQRRRRRQTQEEYSSKPR